MTISIVIPVYNVQDYIKKCLDTILSQTFSDLEIILVDDGSTDLSGRICDYYSENDKRIKVIHTANGGQSEARNVGIKNATSEWITFIDSDDYVSSDYIEYLYNLIQVHNADISIASFTYITPKKIIKHGNGEVALMDAKTAIRRMLLNEGFDMGVWGKMYRTEYFNKYKFVSGKLFEDSLITYQIFSEASTIVFGAKDIYFYVNRKNSTVNGTFNIKKFDLIEMNEEASKFIKHKFPDLSSEAHRRMIWAYFSTLNQVLSSTNEHDIDLYAPQLVAYLLKQDKFIKRNTFIPKRDKIAFFILKNFGLKTYRNVWNLYLKMTR